MSDAKLEILLTAKEMTAQGFADVNRQMQGLTTTAERVNSNLQRIFTRTVEYMASRFAIRGIISSFETLIEKSNTQILADTKLAAVVKSTGAAAGFTTDQLKDYADQLQKVTTFGNETTESAEAILATFTNLSGDVFKRALVSAMDLSTVLGQDLNASVLQLGKALNDPIANMGALGRAGVQFSVSEKQTIKSMIQMGNLAGAQNVMLTEMERQFGGVAHAAGDTFAGSLEILKNSFDDLIKKMGDSITKNNDWIESVKNTQKAVENLHKSHAFKDMSSDFSLFGSVVKEMSKNLDWAVNAIYEIYKHSPSRIGGAGLLDLAKTLKSMGQLDTGQDERTGTRTIKINAGSTPVYGTVPALPAAPAALKLETPTAADWKLFLGDPEVAQDKWEKAVASINQDIQAQADSTITKADWKLFLGDPEVAQDKWEKAVASINEDGKALASDMSSAFDGWATQFSSTLTDAVWGAQTSFGQIAESFGKMLTQMFIQKEIMQPLINNADSFLGGLFTTSAKGNVFVGPGIEAFKNQIVDRPTVFPFARGIGLMGEGSKPEGIFPLTRMPNGDLGVQAEGGAANITVNVINNAGVEVSTRQRDGASGPELDVILGKIVAKQSLQSGTSMNRALRQMGSRPPLASR